MVTVSSTWVTQWLKPFTISLSRQRHMEQSRDWQRTEALDTVVSRLVVASKSVTKKPPINPKITFTNNMGKQLPGGTEFQFDISSICTRQRERSIWWWFDCDCFGSYFGADNIGGLDGTMHRVAFTLPAWKELRWWCIWFYWRCNTCHLRPP